ncbi:MAG: hypothetical protein J6S67_07905 [Methanobrevibacter sp.]|nr:hypothetical protein [Methanobrevibacter sp.]
MAIKKTKEAQTESKPKASYNVEVTRVHDFSKDGKTIIGFDMKVNGVSISGCTYREGEKNGKEWKLVSFPQRKGSDGNYYNIVWMPVSKELTETIAVQIEQML